MGDRIRLSVLTRSLLEDSYRKLVTLNEVLVDKADEERKSSLVKYFKKTMIQFTRLLVLIKWSDKLAEVQTVQDLVMELARRDSLFKSGRESLIETVNGSQALKMPLFDLPTSVDVLATREYKRLPSILEKTHVLTGTNAPRPKLKESEIESTKARLNEMIRLRLMWSKIPEYFEVPEVSDGKVVLRVVGEFEATLTLLQGVTQTAPWTLIHLKYLISPDASFGENYVTTDYNRKVEAVANAAMEADPRNPLLALYSVAHTFAQNLQLEILANQAEVEKNPGTEGVPTYTQTKQKTLVQKLNYVPGQSLELTFASGFRLRFAATGPTAPTPYPTPQTANVAPQTPLHTNQANTATTTRHTRRLRKSKRLNSQLASQGLSLNRRNTSAVSTRGATLTLKEQRKNANKLFVESIPLVLDPLTGDIATYEVDTRAVDLEAIVSRAKRMYAHERLQNLANMIKLHISASQELLQQRIDIDGLETILEATDSALADKYGEINSLPSSPQAFQIQNRSHVVLSLSPDDVAVHLNQGLLKSFISIRLFEHQTIMIQLNHVDGLPSICPGLGLSAFQIDRIQKKLRNYESDTSGSCLAEVLQELQRHAISAALRKLSPSCALQTPPYPGTPSPLFVRTFGEHYIPFLFEDATMSQSRLVVVLDHLVFVPDSHQNSAAAAAAATFNPNSSLMSSKSSISNPNRQLASSTRSHLDTASSSTPNAQTPRQRQNERNERVLPSLVKAYAPVRVRFALLPSQPPETYSSKNAIILEVPDRSEFEGAAENMMDDVILSAMEMDDPISTLSGRGLKRGASESEGLDGKAEEQGARDGSNANGDDSQEVEKVKRRKLVEGSGGDEEHKVSEEYAGVDERGRTTGADVKAVEETLRAEGVMRRSESALARKMSSMEWHWVMEELVRESGTLITRVLLLEELERLQAQYKPYGTPNDASVGGEWMRRRRRRYESVGDAMMWQCVFSAYDSFTLSKYSAAPLQIQQIVITIEHARWFVTLTESQSLLPSNLHIEPFTSPTRSTHYLSQTHQWIFSYPRATTFATFIVDLRGLAFLHKLLLQFVGLSQVHCPSGINQNHYLATTANMNVAQTLTNTKGVTMSGFAFHSANSTLDLNFFRLIAFSPTRISFTYGDNVHSATSNTYETHSHFETHPPRAASSSSVEHFENVFHISWKGNLRNNTPQTRHSQTLAANNDSLPHAVFEPSRHPMTVFINAQLETWFQDPNLRFLLDLVWNVQPVIAHSRAFINDQQARQRLSNLLVLPHSVSKMRFFFRQWFLDWRFLGNRFVCVEEIKRPSDQNYPFLNFIPFMQAALQKIISAPNSNTANGTQQTPTSYSGDFSNQQSHAQHNYGYQNNMNQGTRENEMDLSRPHSVNTPASGMGHMDEDNSIQLPEWTPQQEAVIQRVLSKEHDASKFFLGNTFAVFHAELTLALLPLLQAYFGSLRFFATIEKEEMVQKQLNEQGEYFIPYRRTSKDLEINLVLRKPNYMFDIIFPSSIAQDEVELLTQLLKTKVVCPPYRTVHLRAFLAIFLLPMNSLRDVISLLRYPRDRNIIWELNFSIQDNIIPISVHPPAEGKNDWKIIMALIFTNTESQQSISMSICYNYENRQVSSQDPYTADFLSRNGVSVKPFGSLAGVIDIIFRFFQRVWETEYKYFLTKHPHLAT